MSKPPPVELLSTQIAEAIVASCQQTCGSGRPSLDELLNQETLTTIIEQIRNNKGRVRLGLARRTALKLAPNDTIINKFNSLKSENLTSLDVNMLCASKCDVNSLSKTIQAIIDELEYTEYINSIFEVKSGGRGRTRKQKQATRTRRRHRNRHRYSRRN
jgi:hypothetical protein